MEGILSEKISWLREVLPQEWPLVVIGGAVCVVSAKYAIYVFRCRELKGKMAQRKKKSEEEMEKLKKSLNLENINPTVTELSFEELQTNLRNGSLSAEDVLKAYQAKALDVNERTNALTDIIPSARELARSADGQEPSERGPLHGIPISLKESCGLKGVDCTAGFGTLIDKPMPDDSVFVKVLKAHGAIPFVRTNIPQGMRSYATDNPIYGLTVNPFNNQRSPGGSSGGEGAIIGGGGSILGVGSDIGGSIRIPACYCGIPGLKPTADRLSGAGNFGVGIPVGGQRLVPPSYGPMGKDVTALVQFMRCLVGPDMFSMDPTVPPIPFNEEVFNDKRPLRIGYYTYDGCTRCVPSVVRAVLKAKDALESLGHTVVEFHPPDVPLAMDKFLFPAFFSDECESYRDLCEHDTSCDIMYDWVKLGRYPYFVRWLMGKWRQLVYNDPQGAILFTRPPVRKMAQWFKIGRDHRTYQANFLKQWKSSGLDLVICPCMPSVAFKNGLDRKLLGTVTYTGLYNVLNYPAGTLPITKVTKDDVIKTNDPAHYSPEHYVEALVKEDFDEGAEGMPAGIQVVGLPYREEMVLRVMAELEGSVQFQA